MLSYLVLKIRYNKQFKSDSARLAFSVWVNFSDYGVQLSVVVACFTP
ncbi:DUF3265 domain-containing protein [Vibrio sp. 3-2(1)]|nr:DUF3265 domain-containing protein [Vibrio sp. 3-2(1)]